MTEWIRALNDAPLAGLMLVVALGFSVGRLSWRGLGLGPAGGTLGVAILMGALGLSTKAFYATDDPAITLGDLGFALFIYSVGFEAGPRFFASLRGGTGWRFVVVGVVVNLVALAVAVVTGRALGLDSSVAAGVLAGALTSAPTYAAAAEVCADTSALAISFAVTYPVGLVGVVVLVQFMPRLLHTSLVSEHDDPEEAPRPRSPELERAFDVRAEGVCGRTLRDLDLTHSTGCYVVRIHRGSQVLAPSADTVLEKGDHVMVRGRFDELEVFSRLVGPEVYDSELRDAMPPSRRVRLARRGIHGKALCDLDLAQRHRCLVTSITRGGVVLEPWPELPLQRDDVLEIVGPREGVRAAADELGRFERSTDETDIAIYAAGIFLGILLGRVDLQIGSLHFRLGLAGGLLLTGIVLGRFRRIGPFSAHVPQAARQLVRDLGILLFVAETGVRAGESPFSGLRDALGPALGAGVVVTLVPVLAAWALGHYLFRLRPVDTWGSIGGGMTSSAALVTLRRAADSNEPALSYAASYAVASVLVTIAGPVVVWLM